MDGPNKKLKYDLINNLVENCFVLIIDQFGNYVIQSILTLNEKESSSAIAMKVCDNLPYYSKQKYSSNAIEKCLEFNCKEIHIILLEKILEKEENIIELITNPFGNYIIQKALCVCDNKSYEYLLKVIGNNFSEIKKLSFGFKLISKLVSTHPKLSRYLTKNLFYK
jgi:hypothetical protein